jgi:transposase
MDAKYRPRMGFAAEKRRRLSAAKMFKAGSYPAAVARQLGVTRQAASHWFALWHANGKEGLRGAMQTGRPSKLSQDQLRTVEGLLLQGPQAHGYATALWTLARIAKVIRKHLKVKFHPGHVWRLLGELGWSCQRPERRARERDERAIRCWLRHDWPRIKKQPDNVGRC